MHTILLMLMITSSISCFMMNSWIAIWIMLELNTLAFCSIMKTNMMKKSSSESSMKYFIIQSVSSSIFILSVMLMKNSIIKMMMLMSTTALMIKMGSSPFQQWFINMVEMIEWKTSSILMTWQKLAPIYLVMFQVKTTILPFILLSSLLGSMLQMNKNSIAQIIALSSVFNLSWMLLSIMINLKTMILYSIIYWNSVIMVMVNIKKNNMKSINKESSKATSKMLSLMLIMNLAGIPPMPGFLAKWMVFYESLSMNLKLLITLLLLLSSLNLYIYLRMMNSEMSKKNPKEQKNSNNIKYLTNNLMMAMMIMPLMVISF